MKQASTNGDPTLESMTEAAWRAAANGEWDRVDQYYQQRESFLSQTALSPEALARVLTLDRTIEGRIKVAQAGLASLLDEAARTRQRIQGLRRWSGAISSDSGTIERHI
jgi:hypothetical protein